MIDSTVFRRAVIIIGAVDEVLSLRETVQAIQATCDPADVTRIVIGLAPFATDACRSEAARLAASNLPIQVVVHQEAKENGTAKEAQAAVRNAQDATHAAFWPSDLEVPPEMLSQMIEKAKEHPGAVVTLSRFMRGGSLVASKGRFINFRDSMFRRFVCALYRSKQTDPHYAVSLFPAEAFTRFDLRSKNMVFALEFTMCFDRLGARFVELPLQQRPRTEGKQHVSLLTKLRFFSPVIRLRIVPKRYIFRKAEQTDE